MKNIRDYLIKAFRNPSNLQVFSFTFFIMFIFSITIGPSIYDRGQSGIEEVFRKKNEREFSGDIDVEVWVYSWVKTGVNNMINATGPSQWRAVEWDNACFSRRFTEWNREYQEAIQDACSRLSIVQKKFDSDCLSVFNCNITYEAKNELELVLNNLGEVFSKANFVKPYRSGEENSIE